MSDWNAEFQEGRQIAIHCIGDDEYSADLANDLVEQWSDRRGNYAMGILFTARMWLKKNTHPATKKGT